MGLHTVEEATEIDIDNIVGAALDHCGQLCYEASKKVVVKSMEDLAAASSKVEVSVGTIC